MENENWKPIPGYEGLYDVSNFGGIRSWRRSFFGKTTFLTDPRILKTKIIFGTGCKVYRYKIIGLSKNGVVKSKSVHRLVLMAFTGPPPSCDMMCAHLNGNALDNRLENLKWVTREENESHKFIHGTTSKGIKNPKAKLTEANVLQIRKLDKILSRAELSIMFSISKSQLSAIINRISWSHLD